MFAGKKSAQIREILISESAWEEMTCLFAPSLEVVDSDSGERYGRAADGSITVSASYDGHAYEIQIFNTLPVSQFNGAVVTHTSALEFAGSIDVFDCKKVK